MLPTIATLRSFFPPPASRIQRRQWQTGLRTVAGLLLMFAVLSATAPAHGANQINAAKSIVSSPAALAIAVNSGAYGIFGAIYQTLFGEAKTAAQNNGDETPRSRRPVNPVDVSTDQTRNFNNKSEIPTAQPASCSGGATINVVPGAGTPLQNAITGANPGDTINIAAGTYTEQLTIDKCLTLSGAGAATTIIQAPATLVAETFFNPAPTPIKSIVLIKNSAFVFASNLTVAGPDSTNNGLDYGIFVVGGSTLNMSSSAVRSIRRNPFDGVQQPQAVVAGSMSFSEVGQLIFNNVTITDYQKTAIIVTNSGSSATINNSTITGAGAQAAIGQNGIQVSDGATASITNNTISGNLCDNPACSLTTYYSYGVLTFESAAVTIQNNTFNNNNTFAKIKPKN